MFDLERTKRKWYGNKGEDAEGDVDPEDPMPVALCQRTPDHRTGSPADSPLQGDDSEPLPSLAEGHHVCDDDICERDQATGSDALETTSREEQREGLHQQGETRAEGEEGEGDQDGLHAAEDVGEQGPERLEDGGGEEE